MTNDTKPGKIIIQAGPSTSGKSARAEAWWTGSPRTRQIVDEGTSLAVALELASEGYDVMLNITTDVEFGVYSV